MKIGLAAYAFQNGDVDFNLSQIERATEHAAAEGAELLCFGETFLQGFDALSWDYAADRAVAVELDSPVMDRLRALSARSGVALGVGYVERDGERLYSSYAVLEDGGTLHNYRRVSVGWKEFDRTDEHYCEGTESADFLFHGRALRVALCGDMWDFPERFRTDAVLLWPVYVNFSLEEWETCAREYAEQAALAAKRTLFVNSLTAEPVSHGGAFFFRDGHIERALPFDTEDILIVEI